MRAIFTVGFLMLIIGFTPEAARGDCQRSAPISQYRPIKLKTLGDARRKYLGQQVVIVRGIDLNGRVDNFEWDISGKKASKKKGGENLLGRNGVVVALEELSIGLSSTQPQAKTNALGETVGESDKELSNSSVTVTVRFDDGVVARNSSMLSSIDAIDSTAFRLTSIVENHAQLMQSNLTSVVGRKLYPVNYSWPFPITATLEDLMKLDLTKRILDYPYLEPAEIVGARYVKEFDIVVLKLRLPDGREVLTSSEYRDEDTKTDGPATDNSFLGRISGRFLTEIPSFLTKDEVAAIQKGEIFKGMSRRAVEYIRGGTSNENDWGSGGLQLVYGEHLFVYLDSDCKVSDWQLVGANSH
jgi:hypothetical protein